MNEMLLLLKIFAIPVIIFNLLAIFEEGANKFEKLACIIGVISSVLVIVLV